MIKYDLTIAICAYNRAHIIGECLDSLLAQTVSHHNFTVIVVNNNSTDDTFDVALSYSDKFANFKVVTELEQSASHARNRALSESSTTWIAFLDSDAKAHPDWVEVILETIGRGDFDCFGGPYFAWHHYGPPPVWLPEGYGNYVAPQGYGPLEFPAYIPGGNCALRRDLALCAGGFPVGIGMSAKKCAYGEETALFNLMGRRGDRLGFVPALGIDHCVLPYKYKLSWQLKAYFARGVAYQLLSTDKPIGLLLPSVCRLAYHSMRVLLAFVAQPFTRQPWQGCALKRLEYPIFALGRCFSAIRNGQGIAK